SQRQTLRHVGLLLRKPVFVHGQLYVAASRISNPAGLKILIPNEGGESSNHTTNVVYHEVFNNDIIYDEIHKDDDGLYHCKLHNKIT
ncbi:hypothetical protein ABN254_21710, partial [Providencia rettgeri]